MYIVCVGSPKRSPTLFYAYAELEFIEFIERKKISRDRNFPGYFNFGGCLFEVDIPVSG